MSGATVDPSTDQVVVDDFTAFRERHADQVCFVMGNGPSLNETDLDLLDGHVVFGSNAAFMLWDRVPWRHRYYFACDSRVIPDRADDLLAMLERSPTTELFVPAVLHHWDGSGRVEPTANHLPRGERLHHFRPVPVSSFHLPYTAVSGNMNEGLSMPFTVSINMIEAAVWMGFRMIVLVGCDTSYVVPDDVVAEGPSIGGRQSLLTSTSADPNHFDPDYFGAGRKWHQPHPERMVQHYTWARDAYAPRGIQIVNSTVGGALEVFPRIPLADVVEALDPGR